MVLEEANDIKTSRSLEMQVKCAHEIPLPGGVILWCIYLFIPHIRVVLCVCLSVQAITFEGVDTSFLVWLYILTISMPSLNIKVIWSRSRSCIGKCLFSHLDISLTWFYLSKVKVIPRSMAFQGQILSVSLSVGKWEISFPLKGSPAYYLFIYLLL